MNKSRTRLLIAMQLCSILLLTALAAASVQAQTPATATDNRTDASREVSATPRLKLTFAPKGFLPMPASAKAQASASTSSFTPLALEPDSQVLGSGTIGRLTKWVEFTRNNKAYIGDSSIFEDTNGRVGIGTTTPANFFPFSQVTVVAAGARSGVLGIGGQNHTGNLFSFGITGLGGAGIGTSLSNSSSAGTGVYGQGGNGQTYALGGIGVLGIGGISSLDVGSNVPGSGVLGIGGDNYPQSGEFSYEGGAGVSARGGATSGVGNRGGTGLVALRGEGSNGGTPGFAAVLLGDVLLSGNLQLQGNLNTTGTKNFKIDHPLDPENKYLVHAAIESAEVLNLYSGNVVTNHNGEATVTLPDWFEAINSDFRYQLTVIGSFAQAIIAGEVKDHKFAIKTNAPQVKVSWQVTGVRSDPGMLKHPFKAEEDKPERERGTYLVPEAYNQPEERSTEWARHPKLMQEMKELRAKPTEELKPKAPRDNQ